jgi:hypothetical protein
LKVDQDEYVVSYSQSQLVKVHGEAFDTNRGDQITLVFTLPDGSTNGNKVIPTKDGYFETFLNLDNNSPQGSYEVLASVNAKIIGLVHFTVLAQGLSGIGSSNNNADKESTILDDLDEKLKDSDGDGITDTFDKCKFDKETINDYKDDDGCPDSKPVTNDWELKSSKSQNMVNSKLILLKPEMTSVERSLYDAEFSSTEAQKELKSAWNKLWWAQKSLNDSEVTKKEAELLTFTLKFEEAFNKYEYSLDKAEKIDDYLVEITEHLDNAELLESAYREGSSQKAESKQSETTEEKKTCFLFWCW